MAAAAPTLDATPPPAAPKKGKKKLIIMIAAAVLVLGIAGGAAAVVMKKRAAAAAEAADEGEDGKSHAAKKDAHRAPPIFLPLEPFVVNLADRDVDRFAQIGITLEMEDAKGAEELKAYMPAIRNGILMVLAHKTSKELMERSGKESLALEIMRESVRPLGIDLPTTEAPPAAADDAASDAPAPKAKKKKPAAAEERGPVRHVHFSSFIIQ